MLEGSVAKDLYSHAKQKTCHMPSIYGPQEKDDLRILWLIEILPIIKYEWKWSSQWCALLRQ